MYQGKTLCDLGANINLMLLSVFKQLSTGPAKPTTVTLQMADISIVKPEGKIEDLLVKVDKFILPADFIILDYEADVDVPIILGRSFLETGGAVINVQKGELTMRVHDDEIKFNIVKAIKFQDEGEDLEECFALTLLDNQPSRKTKEEEYEEEEEEPQQEGKSCYLRERRPEPLIRTEKEKQLKRPSSEKPPELELKPLPQHLKYAYLGNNNTLPVIISSFLTKEQEELLLDKLKKYQGAIGWTIADLKVEHERRLNPIMKEVVRKEVIKWLDTWIIYPISDNSLCLIGKMPLHGEKRNSPGTQDFQRRTGSGSSQSRSYSKNAATTFESLKNKLITTPIIQPPDWNLPFELMCDASDHAIGVVLGQRKDKLFRSIYYASKTLNEAQVNYTVTEKELLVVVYACEKFRPYILGSQVTVHTDHAALKYLFSKKEAKPRLIRWVLLLQEFNMEIKERKGCENQIADHLSRLEHIEVGLPIKETFPDEQLFVINHIETNAPWFADIANFLAAGLEPYEANKMQKKKFFHDCRNYLWDEPLLFRRCANQMIRRCVPEEEHPQILQHYHSSPYGGHLGGIRTASKVLQSGFFWPSLF
ncbi:uncharacterized protein LOC133299250 [Gastrolobium bilobum]|uniref:uncharacterized protein LOC133299250 n=1 Tax=Gastrolobium bilobum TaxID=150636 RepID=UPI002AB0C093|nr:uncharacterized protein LOC133299250 [Gastrolobium bilobum]